MAKKQDIARKTVAPAPPAHATKPKTPRVKAAQHSKQTSAEPIIAQTNPDNSREAIAQIAYSYWESRGRQDGAALEDWVRAEHEYKQRLAATRL